jgi:hypothetical protein
MGGTEGTPKRGRHLAGEPTVEKSRHPSDVVVRGTPLRIRT